MWLPASAGRSTYRLDRVAAAYHRIFDLRLGGLAARADARSAPHHFLTVATGAPRDSGTGNPLRPNLLESTRGSEVATWTLTRLPSHGSVPSSGSNPSRCRDR